MAKDSKRKRTSSGGAGSTATSAASAVAHPPDPRIDDPYGLTLAPCRLADHQQRKKNKTTAMVATCDANPNCLYGLGEFSKGIWQGKKLVLRLLGDDPREMQRQAYPTVAVPSGTASPSVVSLHSPAGTRLAPCGLRNLGATCYLNSMLQFLFMTLPFRQAVYDWEPQQTRITAQQEQQMRALQRLFAAMQLGHKNVYDPQEFASTLALNSVMQQDAQEFSKLLLAHLRGIFSHSRVSHHGELVDRLFQGQMKYVTKCLRCQHRSLRSSSYYEISLNIKGHKTVEQCIESYLAPELLDGENKYFCDVCASKECAERFMEVDAGKLPSVLTFQLMRFVYDAHAGKKKKVMDVIEVGETLNMTEILRRCGTESAFQAPRDAVYRLSGYLNHRGKSAHVGHYTASVAHPKMSAAGNGVDWFEFDDNIVNSMTAVVDTDGAIEHHGKVIRSRDAYMLYYTLVDDDMSLRREVAPSTLCRQELDIWNEDFARDVAEYKQRAERLESRIDERMEAYKTFFVNDSPSPAPGVSKYYWIDTEWLKSWVTGEEQRTDGVSIDTRHREGKSKAISVDSKLEAKVDGEATPADESIAEEGATTPMETSTAEDDTSDDSLTDSVKKDPLANSPIRTDAADGVIPFNQPMSIARFCCQHSVVAPMNGTHSTITSDGLPSSSASAMSGFTRVCRFSPEVVNNMKRVSASLFQYLQQTCGVIPFADESVDSTTNKQIVSTTVNPVMMFSAPSYRCISCENEFRDALLKDASKLREVRHELELLKASVVPGESPTFLMSRAWISSYKSHLVQEHKNLLRSRATSKPRKSLTPVKNQLIGGAQTPPNDVWLLGLNQDLACIHGWLTLDKKKYRAMPAQTWLYFSDKFGSSYTFTDGLVGPCQRCVVDRDETDAGFEKARSIRDEILQRPPLKRLSRRRPTTTSGSTFLLSDIFASSLSSGNLATSTSSTQRMFLVPRPWITSWRTYIRDVTQSEPSPLLCDLLTCEHDKLLLPRSVLQLFKGASVDSTTMEVEFINQDEMEQLVQLYGVPDHTYYYVETAPSGQLAWGSCTLEGLLAAQSQALELIPASASVTCTVCEEISETVYQDSLQNFQDREVTVQLLGEDQAVPTSGTLLPDATIVGRRRSKRIKLGSGATWSIVANAKDTIYELKNKIYSEIDEYPMRQRLYFRGNPLQDNLTLKACGIKAGDVVYMRLAEDIPEELLLGEEGHEREVGFEDSVFLTRHPVTVPTSSSAGATSVWVCLKCTYVNDDVDELCEMCSTPNPLVIIE